MKPCERRCLNRPLEARATSATPNGTWTASRWRKTTKCFGLDQTLFDHAPHPLVSRIPSPYRKSLTAKVARTCIPIPFLFSLYYPILFFCRPQPHLSPSTQPIRDISRPNLAPRCVQTGVGKTHEPHETVLYFPLLFYFFPSKTVICGCCRAREMPIALSSHNKRFQHVPKDFPSYGDQQKLSSTQTREPFYMADHLAKKEFASLPYYGLYSFEWLGEVCLSLFKTHKTCTVSALAIIWLVFSGNVQIAN